jgi:purine-binding chemotaxis protein CheW
MESFATQTVNSPATPPASAQAHERSGKYLIFHLGEEEFGTRILKVREIIGLQDITMVPQTPSYVRGVINLRGKVIPVIDLRLKLGMPEVVYTQRTCIIVVHAQVADSTVLKGIVVDGVSEVLNVSAADIEDTPDFGEQTQTAYLLGMAKIKGSVKILLDIDQVLTSPELLLLTQERGKN